MLPLLTPDEMRALDRTAIDEIGIPSLVLMETAGRAVADTVDDRTEDFSPVLAVCGLGNNGGDGVVAARCLLSRDRDVTIAVLGDPNKTSDDMRRQLDMAEKLDMEIVFVGEEDEDTLALLMSDRAAIIDAIFGTGLTREVTGLPKKAIEAMNASDALVVSVDLPSGLHGESGQILGIATDADVTVTFQLPKLGHVIHPGRDLSGEVVVVDIGIPTALFDRIDPKAHLVEDEDLAELDAPRLADTHKGTYGHLLVVAGIEDRPGAALLCGRAALRFGTGLVTVGSDGETIARAAAAFNELMGLNLGDGAIGAARIIEAAASRSALAIGPSLEPNDALGATVREVLEAVSIPVVVDAGALDALGAHPKWLSKRRFGTVLTPHPKEMARLLGLSTAEVQADRLKAARTLAAETGAVAVLKGSSSVVAQPDGRVVIVTRGNPGMASGGMGDVLTGMIGALLAQGYDAFRAAAFAVHRHAQCGDRASERVSEAALIASDLIDELARE